jgi:fatty-acyl-CoA synthase
MHATAPPALDWLAMRARLGPSRTALVDAASGARVDYASLDRRVSQTARLLRSMGVGAGDRVALLCDNCIEYLEVVFACARLGAVAQHLNTRLAAAEMAPLVAAARPRAVVHGGAQRAMVQALRADLPSGCVLVLARGERAGADEASLAARDLLAATAFDGPAPHGADAWMLCYTGGSTGIPKAAVSTHDTVLWNAIQTIVGWGLRDDDVAILCAPLFHAGGLHVLTTPLLYLGGASIVCERFDAGQVLDLVGSGQATLLFGVPTMFAMLAEHPRFSATDLSRLRLVISGGATAPAWLFRAFFDKGVPFKTGYGLTEAGPNTFWLPDDFVRDKPGSVGAPLPHIELELRDGRGAPLSGHDVEGELCIRGRHVMAGYFEDAAATAAAIDERGWLRTGDVARRDADGHYRIVGRIKEMFVSGGENVYPVEVEDALRALDGVADAAVIAVPDARWGEVGHAFVRLSPGVSMEGDALRAALHGRLASYKRPRAVEVVDDLPRTGAGKIDKRALAALLAARHD